MDRIVCGLSPDIFASCGIFTSAAFTASLSGSSFMGCNLTCAESVYNTLATYTEVVYVICQTNDRPIHSTQETDAMTATATRQNEATAWKEIEVEGHTIVGRALLSRGRATAPRSAFVDLLRLRRCHDGGSAGYRGGVSMEARYELVEPISKRSGPGTKSHLRPEGERRHLTLCGLQNNGIRVRLPYAPSSERAALQRGTAEELIERMSLPMYHDRRPYARDLCSNCARLAARTQGATGDEAA